MNKKYKKTLREIKKHITISEGNIKLGAIPSISLPPIITCNKSAPCTKGECYILPLLKFRPSVATAYQKNLNTYKNSPNIYFESLGAWLYKKKPSFFRFHVSGDIPDKNYLNYVISLAKEFPNIKFLIFTKRYNFLSNLNGKTPKNLSIIVSCWTGYRLTSGTKPYRKAWLSPDKRMPKDAVECFGNCTDCGMCWSLKTIGRDVFFKKHGNGKTN